MEIKKYEKVKNTYTNNELKNTIILILFYKHFESFLKENEFLFTSYNMSDKVKKKFNETSNKVDSDISILNKIENNLTNCNDTNDDFIFERAKFIHEIENGKFFLKNDKILNTISENLEMLANNLKFKKEIDKLKENLEWYKSSDLFETKKTQFSTISFK